LSGAELLVLKHSGVIKKATEKVSIFGSKGWRSQPMVSFNQSEMQRLGVAGMSIRSMEKFLQEC
jgi:hypothetical protein